MITFDLGLSIFYSTHINNDRFFSGFSTKISGDARDIHAIMRFLDFNKIMYKRLIVLGQIHSVNIHFYDKKNGMMIQKVEDVDGIITDQKNVALAVRNADCLPIIFVDLHRGLIGISHQGWRGSLKKMAVKMIDAFTAHGSKKEHIYLALGPAIGACCYDITDDQYYQFMEEFNEYEERIFHFEGGKRHLNLSLLNYLQLCDADIAKSHIDFFPFCTKCDSKHFYSFRRGRDKKESFGNMFSFVMKM